MNAIAIFDAPEGAICMGIETMAFNPKLSNAEYWIARILFSSQFLEFECAMAVQYGVTMLNIQQTADQYDWPLPIGVSEAFERVCIGSGMPGQKFALECWRAVYGGKNGSPQTP